MENELPGQPSTEWDINGAGDPTLQGFATEISVAAGDTVHFKVRTDARSYRMDVYRMGYYSGAGARRVASVEHASPGEPQPPCLFEEATLLVDCANWAVSLSWPVPRDAVSGIYFGRLVRTDDVGASWRADNSPVLTDPKFARRGWDPTTRPEGTMATHAYGAAGHGRRRNALREPRASHAFFVVRDDSHASDILYQTGDPTWQAYNCWGAANTYGVPCDDSALQAGSPPPPNASAGRRAYKASYNRPIATRAYRAVNMPFNSEYPMVRWLERNGYDVSYWAGADADRYGHRLASGRTAHRLYLSVGHDEYWSGAQRAAVAAARDRGVALAFFSGNEVYWRTRWEADAHGSPHRTLVVYKESQDVAKIDPNLDEWTGTWRDGRPINPLGAMPENELTGTVYTVNAWRNDPLRVPARYAPLRFWRNTSVAALLAGEEAMLVQGLLGHEWDEDLENGHRPAGLMHLSSTTVDDVQYLVDEGATYDTGSATHHLTLYRHGSGALVFGGGTCQWSWGLDGHHDSTSGLHRELGKNCYSLRVGVDPLRPGGERDVQQATLNLFSDMRVMPSTPQAELVLTPPSSDTAPPTVAREAVVRGVPKPPPDAGGGGGGGLARRLEGSSEDGGGGVVASVEVSLDGGGSWRRAEVEPVSGAWHLDVDESEAPADARRLRQVLVRAADDSANLSPEVVVGVREHG